MDGQVRFKGRRAHLTQPHYARRTRLPDHLRFRVPPSLARPKRMFIWCRACSYSPPGDVPVGGVCPKCGGGAWERFCLPEPLVPEHMKQARPAE